MLALVIVTALQDADSAHVIAHGELYLIALAMAAGAIADTISAEWRANAVLLVGILSGTVTLFSIAMFVLMYVTAEIDRPTDETFLLVLSWPMVILAALFALAARFIGSVREGK